MASIIISGRIYDYILKSNLESVVVELWNSRQTHDEYVDSVSSEANGTFSFSIDNSNIKKGFLKVLVNGKYVNIIEGDSILVFLENVYTELGIDYRVESNLIEELKLFVKVKHNDSSIDFSQLYAKTVIDVGLEEDNPELFSGKLTSNGLFGITWKRYSNSPYTNDTPILEVITKIFNKKNGLLKTEASTVDFETDFAFEIDLENLSIHIDVSPKISDLGLTIPSNLQAILDSEGIETLEKIRVVGGLQNLDEIDSNIDEIVVAKLDAYANLDVIINDIEKSAVLIEKGYSSLRAIAKENHAEFIQKTRTEIGDYNASVIHENAVVFNKSLEKLVVEDKLGALKRAQGGNLYAKYPDSRHSVLFPDNLTSSCQCTDCASGVSPLAYLADLMSYTLRNVKDNNQNLSVYSLPEKFCQPFNDLPLSCEMIHTKFCQIRLAVEILRCNHSKIESNLTPCQLNVLQSQINEYLEKTYLTLLDKIGTSYQELRDSRNWSLVQKEKLCNKLGIPISFESGGIVYNTLEILFIDFQANSSNLSEAIIEEIFGLRNTGRPQLEPTPQSNLLNWRKKYLREKWIDEDQKINKLSKYLNNQFVIIDPDLLSLKDFRVGEGSFVNEAKNIWQTRRTFIDGVLELFSQTQPGSTTCKIDELIDLMTTSPNELKNYSTFTLSTNIWESSVGVSGSDITTWRDEILSGDFSSLDTVHQVLLLDKAKFLRFSDLYIKDKNNAPESLTLEEWVEVYYILSYSVKQAFTDIWLNEEDNESIKLNNTYFWPALEEPKEGYWTKYIENTYTSTERIPIVDPELVKISQLNSEYATIWNNRKAELDAVKSNLSDIFKTPPTPFSGMEAIMNEALLEDAENPIYPNPYTSFSDILTDLNSTEENVIEDAKQYVLEHFKISVIQFRRLMDLKSIDEDASFELTDEELNEALNLLTSANKKIEFYPTWNQDELGTQSLTYWKVLKHQLPKYATSLESRNEWKDLFATLNAAPILDPDYIKPDSFVYPTSGIIYALWNQRNTSINNEFASMATPIDGSGYDNLLSNYIIGGINAINELHVLKNEGKDIKKRLMQLHLDYDSLTFLIEIGKVLDNSSTVLGSEWDEVKNILVQIWKANQFYTWNAEERNDNISLSQDYFKLDDTIYNSIDNLKKWRTNFLDRMRWERLLKARIEQEKTIIESLETAINETEDETLGILRDAFIEATGEAGQPFDSKAKALTSKLLVDMQNNCCARTTRVSQAIETLQGLLWSINMGLLKDTHPNYSLVTNNFDSEWQWIGSYATWRSAMFVFLFPENILLPSLRKRQTPRFRMLVEEIRKNQRFTPNMACESARNYSEYFRDVCNLKVEASCEAITELKTGNCLNKEFSSIRCLLYMFGRRPAGNKVYWSVTNPLEEKGYQQTFWEVIEGLDNVVQVLGSVVYEVIGDGKYLYLFVKTNNKGLSELQFIRFNLTKLEWETDPVSLKLYKHDDIKSFQVVVKKSSQIKQPPHLVIKIQPFEYVMDRKLNEDGTDWEDKDWRFLTNWSNGRSYKLLKEFIEIDKNQGLLVYQNNYSISTKARYRIIGSKDDYKSNVAVSFLSGVNNFKYNDTVHLFSKIASDCKKIKLGDFTTTTFSLLGHNTTNNKWVVSSLGLRSLNHHIKLITGIDFLDYIYDFNPKPETNHPNLKSIIFKKINNTSWYVMPNNSGNGDEEKQTLKSEAKRKWDFSKGKPIIGLPHLGIESGVYRIQNWIDGHEKDLLEGGWSTDLWKENWKIANDIVKGLTINNIGIFDVFRKILSFEDVEFKVRTDEVTSFSHNIPDFEYMVPKSSDKSNTISESPYIIHRRGSYIGNWKYYGVIANSAGDITVVTNEFFDALNNSLIDKGLDPLSDTTDYLPTRVNPRVTAPLNISEDFTSQELQTRKTRILSAFTSNAGDQKINSIYLQEAYYFLPMHLAGELENRAHYLKALDWYKTVYNYTEEYNKRKIYYGLVTEETLSEVFNRADNWFLDPLNPHLIASTRPLTYTRYTIMAIIRCLLAYADSEFTIDTAESVPRARALYLAALELLSLDEMQTRSALCEGLHTEIWETIQCNIISNPTFGDWEFTLNDLISSTTFSGLSVAAALDLANGIKASITSEQGLHEIVSEIQNLISAANANTGSALTFSDLSELHETEMKTAQFSILSSPAMVEATQLTAQHKAGEFTWNMQLLTGESTSSLKENSTDLPWLMEDVNYTNDSGIQQGDLFASQKRIDLISPNSMAVELRSAVLHPNIALRAASQYTGAYIPILHYGFCVPDNPVMSYYRMQAEMNLFKIRNCMNIAGIKRELDPYAAPTDTTSGLPYIGVGGNLVLAGSIQFPATPYHYQVIIARAKELIQIAQQIESQFLSLLEKRDAEYYNIMKARQDLRLSKAGVRLQDLRLKTAEQEVDLAELQMERSELQVQGLEEMINAGLNEHEQRMIQMYSAIAMLDTLSIIGRGLISVAQANGANFMFELSNKALTISGLAISVPAEISRAYVQAGINQNSILSSFARRKQEWDFQKTLATHDVKIGAQGVKIAESRLRVAGQEKAISELQEEFANDTVEFLSNKFTNVELYDWMSGVMEGVYSYFLRQATSTAKLGERQLAFERQQLPPPFIKDDYWVVPIDNNVVGTIGGNETDRRGLTGSAMLLQDIYQLDQHAFDTDKRRLNLSKTFSLSQLSPIEFQRFKETGKITFDTLKQYFDDDFPGHYMRLIKKVKVSVIALIPPNEGIKATLSSTGLSQVTVKGNTFQEISIRRSPESVALTSAREATGIFEMEPEPEKLNPFEASGVHTRWEYKLPKATNRFNFNTIADVLFTVEYTAFHDVNLERQSVQTWDPFIGLDRSFSFRQAFADQWFDLNNPDQTATPLSVQFKIDEYDYPPNIDAIALDQLMLLFITDGAALNLGPTGIDVTLKLHNANGDLVGQGEANLDNSGYLSTLSGGAAGFTNIANGVNEPGGTWTLEIPDTPENRALFSDGIVKDILFVTTISGLKPPYPID